MTRSPRTTVKAVRAHSARRRSFGALTVAFAVTLAVAFGALVMPLGLQTSASADPAGEPPPAGSSTSTPTSTPPGSPSGSPTGDPEGTPTGTLTETPTSDPTDTPTETPVAARVVGTVSDARCRLPIGDSPVHLVFTAAETWQTMTTGANGAFGFHVVASGDYIVLASADGYENGWVDTTATNGSTTIIGVVLTRKATESARDCATGEHPAPPPSETPDDGTPTDTPTDSPTDTPTDSPTGTPTTTPTPTTAPGATAPGGTPSAATTGGSTPATSNSRLSTRRPAPIRPIELEPPATAVETITPVLPTVPEFFGQTTASMLAQFRAQSGLSEPATLAMLFGIADIGSMDMSNFTAWTPWPANDTAVEVWSYSWPVYVGTFPVSGSRVGLIGLDLASLGPGTHHLVIRGVESGDYRIASFANGGTTVEDRATPVDLRELGTNDTPAIDPWTRVAWIFGIAGLAILGVMITAGNLARKYREQAGHRA